MSNTSATSAIKNVLNTYYKNLELDEFLAKELAEAGYGGVDIQKTPLGTRVILYVTRPGIVIGRRGLGIKDLTDKLSKYGLQNPQVSVSEIEVPELNPRVVANRVVQLLEKGTAFRRAALWALNSIMNAGALGAEVIISGKLRSERANFEKYTMGIIPKSGEYANTIVKEAVAHLQLRLGTYGIKIKIAYKDPTITEFKLKEEAKQE